MIARGSSVGEAVDLTGGGASAEADRQGDGEAVYRLDLFGRNLTRGPARVVSHRCKSRFCPTCGPVRGFKTREVLLSEKVLGLFREPRFLTLTVNPSNFDSPEHAYDYINEGSYVPRLFRLLGLPVWVKAVEMHVSGWPHFHCVVDASGVEGWIDLVRVWRLWRDSWGIGGCDLGQAEAGISARHAMFYITKYLMKPSSVPWPEWLLKKKRVRLIAASKAVGAVSGVFSGDSDGCGGEREVSSPRSIGEVVSECNSKSRVVSEVVDLDTGVVSWSFCGELPVSRDDLVLLKLGGDLPDDVSAGVTVEPVVLADGFHTLEVFLDLAVFRRLESFLVGKGYVEGVRMRVKAKCENLLMAHEVFMSESGSGGACENDALERIRKENEEKSKRCRGGGGGTVKSVSSQCWEEYFQHQECA